MSMNDEYMGNINDKKLFMSMTAEERYNRAFEKLDVNAQNITEEERKEIQNVKSCKIQVEKLKEERKEENKARRYNSNKRRWGLLHYKSLELIIKVLEYGAHKYTIYEDEEGREILGKDIPIADKDQYKVKVSGENNWRNGLDDRATLESAQRHIASMMDNGVDSLDAESGIEELGHLGCNYLFLAYNMLKRKGEI